MENSVGFETAGRPFHASKIASCLRRAKGTALALAFAFASLAFAPAAYAADWTHVVYCTHPGSFVNKGSNTYVSVFLDYDGDNYGMLRASGNPEGSGRNYFRWCLLDDGAMALYSMAADKWVSAELGRGGDDYAMLRARADQIGPWEHFWPQCQLDDGYIGFVGPTTEYGNFWVSAELGYGPYNVGMLRARAMAANDWEKFSWSTWDGVYSGQQLCELFYRNW
jgi:hypothetical protein